MAGLLSFHWVEKMTCQVFAARAPTRPTSSPRSSCSASRATIEAATLETNELERLERKNDRHRPPRSRGDLGCAPANSDGAVGKFETGYSD